MSSERSTESLLRLVNNLQAKVHQLEKDNKALRHSVIQLSLVADGHVGRASLDLQSALDAHDASLPDRAPTPQLTPCPPSPPPPTPFTLSYSLPLSLSSLHSFSWHSSSPYLVAGDFTGAISLWKPSDRERERDTNMVVHSLTVAAVSFVEGHVTSASYDGTVRRTDVETRVSRVVLEPAAGFLLSLCESRASHEVTYVGSQQGALFAVDARSSQRDPTPLLRAQANNAVTSICALNDGYSVTTAGHAGFLELWDTRSPTRPLATSAVGPSLPISSLSLSQGSGADPSSWLIGTVGWDDKVRLMDCGGWSGSLAPPAFADVVKPTARRAAAPRATPSPSLPDKLIGRVRHAWAGPSVSNWPVAGSLYVGRDATREVGDGDADHRVGEVTGDDDRGDVSTVSDSSSSDDESTSRLLGRPSDSPPNERLSLDNAILLAAGSADGYCRVYSATTASPSSPAAPFALLSCSPQLDGGEAEGQRRQGDRLNPPRCYGAYLHPRTAQLATISSCGTLRIWSPS